MHASVNVEEVAYGGWPNCRRLSNGTVELVVTTDVGPRIIRFGFVGEDNEFYEDEHMLGKTGGDEWRAYGGHRLWHAPEVSPRTYWGDNVPVRFESHPGVVRLVQPVELTTRIQKELDLQFGSKAHVQVTHRLRNRNPWAVELAPWAISQMAPRGTAIIPLPPRRPHSEALLPVSTLALWAYLDMSDARWTWGHQYILLRQDPCASSLQKVGAWVPDGWVAYVRQGHLFAKTFTPVPGATYPDLGCSAEVFTNAQMLELETLGPSVRLQPDASVEHVEHWLLFRDVPAPANDADVENCVMHKLGSALGRTRASPPHL
jgi:hypothetical protein